MTTTSTTTAISAAAQRLRSAASLSTPCLPVRDLIGSEDVVAAYAVQRENIDARIARGARIVGRKVGLTSVAVQQQLGVNQPDFGVLLDNMAYADGAVVPQSAVLQPRAEAEIAFVLADDLREGDLDDEQVRAAIGFAVAAIEICGSRIANWDITFADTVADNASAGAYVLGDTRRTLDEFDPITATMTMSIDGVEVSRGSGAACLGDPVNAVVWLAKQARAFGDPLRAGQVVLSGALGPMCAVMAGNSVTSTVTGLGTVGFTLGGQR